VIGHSAGGWGALALAAKTEGRRRHHRVRAGRGGHANDFPNQVCAPHTLMAAAANSARRARAGDWLVAANDSYFSPAFRATRRCFRAAAARSISACCGLRQRGHWLPETEGG
jgi:hypothetical protein